METFVIAMTAVQVIAFALLVRYVLSAVARMNEAAKASQGSAEREARLLELYGHVEEVMDVFESYIEEVRRDVEKERAALTEMSRQAAALFSRASAIAAAAEHQPASVAAVAAAAPPRYEQPPRHEPPPVPKTTPAPAVKSHLSSKDREALGRFATKPQRVRFLMGRGLPLEEVARELGIGTGEVRLIAELEK